MNATGKRTLLLGSVIIVATNAIALGGVAFNRSGEPDSTLELTEREAPKAIAWEPASDDGGLDLTLRWRVLTRRCGQVEPTGTTTLDTLDQYGYGPRDWLDRKQLESLGIDSSLSPEAPGAEDHYGKALGREVLLVLEFDGAAHAAQLRAAEARAAEAAATAAEHPDDKESAAASARARDVEKDERYSASRLFAIDAGLDAGALRRQYPGRSQYAIVHGQVRPYLLMRECKKPELVGRITRVRANTFNVPVRYRAAIGGRDDEPSNRGKRGAARYHVTVAFGRRLEPSLMAARRDAAIDSGG